MLPARDDLVQPGALISLVPLSVPSHSLLILTSAPMANVHHSFTLLPIA